MLDIAQLALQNDLFVAGGIGFFLNLPFVRPYWKPGISSKPLPEQPQITPHSEATLTQTVTVVPNPITVIPEPITIRPTRTVYDTVTKNITSISTVVNQQVVTKRRCLLTDSTAPRATFIKYSEVCTLPKQMCARCLPCAPLPSSKPASPIISTCPEASCAPCAPCAPCTSLPSAEFAFPVISTSGVWTPWALLSLAAVVLGAIFLISRLDLISKRVAKAEDKATKARLNFEAEKKSHKEWKTKACGYSAKLETIQEEVQNLLEDIARRNNMLQLLGVFADSDQIVDEESLFQKVRERKRWMEAEKAAQSKKIRELEAEKARAKELQTKTPTPETLRQFQRSLDDKQNEINFWRNSILGSDIDATIKEFHQRCEEKDAELKQLRPLPAEINELKQTLSDASKRIETLQQEKKDQGIADRRRWIEEKKDLSEKHAKDIKALKEDLKEAQQSSTRSKSARRKTVSRTQPKDSEDTAANRQLLVGLEAEQNKLATETMNLRSQNDMNETFSTVSRILEKTEKERDEYKMALEYAESIHAAENKQLFEDLKAAQNALVMADMNRGQEVGTMIQQASEVVRELEEVKEDRDELRKKRNDLEEECDDLEDECNGPEMDLEDQANKKDIADMQRDMDLRAEQNAIGMQNMTLQQLVYDMEKTLTGLSRDLEKASEENEEL